MNSEKQKRLLLDLRAPRSTSKLPDALGQRKITSLQQKILRLRQDYEAALDTMPVGVYRTTQEGTILYANLKFAKILGYSSPEQLKHEVRNLGRQVWVHPSERELLKKRLLMFNAQTRLEVQMYRRNGRTIWVEVNAQLCRRMSGKVPVYEGTIEDITRRKNAERRSKALLKSLREANQRLDNINRALSEFTEAVAHDFKQPLFTVSSLLELIRRRTENVEIDNDTRLLLDSAISSSQVSSNFIKELLEYISIVEGGGKSEDTDLERIYSETVQSMKAAILKSGAFLTSDPLPTVRIPPAHARTLFLNLLGNAIKYRGDVPLRLQLEVKKSGRYCELSFIDNGIGFDNDQAERVFNMFERLPNVGRTDGAGIGLALCKKIVERSRGSISVQSQVGRGTTFTVRLPLAKKARESRPAKSAWEQALEILRQEEQARGAF